MITKKEDPFMRKGIVKKVTVALFYCSLNDKIINDVVYRHNAIFMFGFI